MLSASTKDWLQKYATALPDDLRRPRATEEKLRRFEASFGPIPPDYRWFLLVCGGGCFGSEELDGIDQLETSHTKFRRESGPPRGWTMTGVFIVGWDGGGNPFGIEAVTGRVSVEDHDFGGIHELAPSFERLLLAWTEYPTKG
jgi:hypothetical protein